MHREVKATAFYILTAFLITAASIGLQFHFGGEAYRHVTWIDIAVPLLYSFWWSFWGEKWLFP